MLVSCSGSDGSNASPSNLYLRGDMNGWNVKENYRFQQTGNVHELSVYINAGSYEFKIGDANWSATANYGSPGESVVTVGATSELALAENPPNLQGNFAESTTYTFRFDDANLQLTISPNPTSVSTRSQRYRNPPINDKWNNLRIYQVMVGSFQDGSSTHNYQVGWGPSDHNGDLQGIIDALDYIQSLNVNAIWLTPIFDSQAPASPSASNYDHRLNETGYFTCDYFNVDPNFGTNEDFRKLLKQAHSRGLYVFLDGVFGHHKNSCTGGHPVSPTGNRPSGSNNPVDYPASLEFYKEVASYWIKEYGIDGWRLDQAYQVPTQYWSEIRQAVEQAAQARADAGFSTGTLGYMVGELWHGSAQPINNQWYGSSQARVMDSAFDFPARYNLVQAIAADEGGSSNHTAGKIEELYSHQMTYPDHAMPNLMIGNHDLVRFGDLIERAGLGDYWQRHRLAFDFLTLWSGPITIYYGEEIGMELANFAARVTNNCANQGANGMGLCDDHVARSNGKISDFSTNEQSLKDFVASRMLLKSQQPALWGGQSQLLYSQGALYAELKRAPTSADHSMVFVVNLSTQAATLPLPIADLTASSLSNVDDAMEVIPVTGSSVAISLNGLSAKFFLLQ